MIGDRVDAAHPACRAWVGPVPAGRWVYGMPVEMAIRDGMIEPAPAPASAVLMRETALTVPEFAQQLGVSVEEAERACREELASALIPPGHVSAAEFAQRADLPIDEVLAAVADELAEALLPSGRLDLGHSASLRFMAARPFERLASGDPAVHTINGEPYLAPACVGEDIDIDHPVARAFLARCHGRVQTDEELELT
ncbi:MAG TPA: hypothetical protein VHW01_20315 [Polyangiaceae bacterium]|jgi:hypothetical protein|nr:hypothetical protein [Polyangiaceae bacterium]